MPFLLPPPPPPPPPTVPKTSKFLTEDENEVLATACNNRGWLILALGLAEVYKLDLIQERWHHAHSGVACCIKDYAARLHFVRLFDFNVNDFVCEFRWLFPDFTYSALRSYFHTFEADDCYVGLSFAYQEEAESFHAAVEKAWTTAERNYSKKHARTSVHTPQVPCTPSQNIAQTSVAKDDPQVPCTPSQNIAQTSVAKDDPQVPCSADGTYNMPRRSIKKPQGMISKDNITQPVNFRHLQHVGWDPTKGFDLQYVVDFALHKFSDLASVSPRDLADNFKQKFTCDFVERNGGIDVPRDLLNPTVVSREAGPSLSPPTRRQLKLPERTSSLKARRRLHLPKIQFPSPPPPMVRPRRLGKGAPPPPPLPIHSPQENLDVPPTPLPRKVAAH